MLGSDGGLLGSSVGGPNSGSSSPPVVPPCLKGADWILSRASSFDLSSPAIAAAKIAGRRYRTRPKAIDHRRWATAGASLGVVSSTA